MVPRRETLGGLQGGACVPSKEEEDREGGVIVAFLGMPADHVCTYLGFLDLDGLGVEGFLRFRLVSFIHLERREN